MGSERTHFSSSGHSCKAFLTSLFILFAFLEEGLWNLDLLEETESGHEEATRIRTDGGRGDAGNINERSVELLTLKTDNQRT